MSNPLLVVSALPREIEPLARRLMAVRSRISAGATAPAMRAWQATVSARTVLLAATGCGSGPATAAMARLLAEARPACVVSTGICGGLVHGLRTGHLVLADRVRREGEASAREAPQRLLAPAAAALAEAAVPVHRGLLVSVQRVVCTPGDKARLAQETGAAAADMESGWVAEECDRAQVPWVVVRAVMDEAEHPTAIDYGRFLSPDGDVRTLRIVLHALFRPWLWSALSIDGERTKEASQSLSRALARLLASIGTIV